MHMVRSRFVANITVSKAVCSGAAEPFRKRLLPDVMAVHHTRHLFAPLREGAKGRPSLNLGLTPGCSVVHRGFSAYNHPHRDRASVSSSMRILTVVVAPGKRFPDITLLHATGRNR